MELRQATRRAVLLVPRDGDPGARTLGLRPAFRSRTGHTCAAKRAAELLLSRHLLWRSRDGALIEPDWGSAVDRIAFPIQFYDVLFALEVIADIGRLEDPRCEAALDLLESKRLADGGYPLEERVGTMRDVVASRGTFADWGPAGGRRSNPFVTIRALRVLREAGAARAGRRGEPEAL